MTQTREPEIVTLEQRIAAVVRESVRMEAMPDFFGRAFHRSMAVMAAQGVTTVGPPVGVYFGWPSDTADVAAGFPADRPIIADAGVDPLALPGGRAATVVHVGPYDTMEATYGRLMAWLGAQGLTPGEVMWEEYLTEPDPAHPEAIETRIVWPLQD